MTTTGEATSNITARTTAGLATGPNEVRRPNRNASARANISSSNASSRCRRSVWSIRRGRTRRAPVLVGCADPLHHSVDRHVGRGDEFHA